MQDSKLVEILKTLTPEEFKDLEKFAASPYFIKSRDLTPYIRILKPFYPKFTDKNLNKDYLYSKLYPGKERLEKNSAATIKTLSSDLIKMIKDFFKQVEFRKDINRGNYYLADQLRSRKIYKEFEKEYKDSLSEQESSDGGSVSDLIEKYFLEKVNRDCSLDRDNFESSFEANLSMSEYSVVIALVNAFKHEDEKNLADGYTIDVRNNMMEHLLNNLDSEKLLNEMKAADNKFYPYLKIFYLIYKMNKHKGAMEFFYELKELLIKHKQLFGQPELYVLWNIMLTYCTVGNKEKNDELNLETFEIYKYMLESNIFRKSDNEVFHVVLFRNIVFKASRFAEYEWLEKFIDKYSGELHTDHRDNMKYYSLAHLFFAKRQFDKALEYLIKIRYDLFIYKVDIRMLSLEIYYELRYFEQTYSAIDATLHFLKHTNELSDFIKEHVYNFVKYLRELLRIITNEKRDTAEIRFLEKKITDEKVISQRDWLLNKAAELKM
ncbi:MAG: hypothetical protein ABI462_01040 [Ignavibacteria bacterium]